jgi:hypothetical protein
VVICSAGFSGGPGGEFGDAPPGVPLVDPAADAGFQGGDAAVGEAAQLAGGQLSEPALHQVQSVARWIEARTGWSIRKFVKTARRCRTIEVQAGRQTVTAAGLGHVMRPGGIR